jgi:hypothetical protein
MEAIVNWVQAMTDEGHIATEIRVAEPNEALIEYTTATDTFFAVVSH